MDSAVFGLNVLLLRAETLVGHSFENTLRGAGHPVTVISSREAAFSLIESMEPDLLVFDPISEFGFSGSVQRLRASFKGPIVATGLDADSPMASRLRHLGILLFAADATELLEIASKIPVSQLRPIEADPLADEPGNPEPESPPTAAVSNVTGEKSNPEKIAPVEVPGKWSSERWHWATAGLATAVIVMAIVLIAVMLPGAQQDDVPVAKALPIVPTILLKPLAPLTIEELSGETLPLKIFGISDRTVIDAPAVAFWGDTAPDAFVSVNGEQVEVSEYGAFVVDYPLDDGANFIEILASDFQGRTTRVSITLVRTQ